jgi:hypothetical protein
MGRADTVEPIAAATRVERLDDVADAVRAVLAGEPGCW